MPITIRIKYGARESDTLTVEITDVTNSAVEIKDAALSKGLSTRQAVEIIEKAMNNDYEVVK